MNIYTNDNFEEIIDKHFSILCPNCGCQVGINAISIPTYSLITKYQLKHIGIAYCCEVCKKPVFIKFEGTQVQDGYYIDENSYKVIGNVEIPYDYSYLPESVAEDFKEALTCFSNSCYNAFGAMCRRCVQSISTELGAKGKDKVQKQLEELKHIVPIDDNTYEILEQTIIAGHDGAHPHLPKLSPERAKILLELIKDVLYQLFVRKAKIQETTELRKKQIEQDNK